MELNSTQEPAADGDTMDAESPLQHPVGGMHQHPAETEAPVEKEDVVYKKTTIQLFTSTTVRLTSRKHGNDTYNDVINRDLDSLGCPSAEQIVKAQEGQ